MGAAIVSDSRGSDAGLNYIGQAIGNSAQGLIDYAMSGPDQSAAETARLNRQAQGASSARAASGPASLTPAQQAAMDGGYGPLMPEDAQRVAPEPAQQAAMAAGYGPVGAERAAQLAQQGMLDQPRATQAEPDAGAASDATVAQGPRSVRAGDYRGSLERIAREQLGPNASQREINAYVGQLFEINQISDARKIGAERMLQLPDQGTPAATAGLQQYGADIQKGEQIKTERAAEAARLAAITDPNNPANWRSASPGYQAAQAGGPVWHEGARYASAAASLSPSTSYPDTSALVGPEFGGTRTADAYTEGTVGLNDLKNDLVKASRFVANATVGTVQQIVDNPMDSVRNAGHGVIGLLKGVPNFVTETATQASIGVRYLAVGSAEAVGLAQPGALSREIDQYRNFSGRLSEYDNSAESVAGFVSGFATPAIATKGVAAMQELNSAARTAAGASEAWAVERAAVLAEPRAAVGSTARTLDLSNPNVLLSSAPADLAGVERATPKLLSAIEERRAVTIAEPGTDAERFLNYRGAEAAAFGAEDILVRPNPSKAALLEEFLHGTQQRLGIIDDIGRAASETHVKDFMIRHQDMLGLSAEDVRRLQILKDMGL